MTKCVRTVGVAVGALIIVTIGFNAAVGVMQARKAASINQKVFAYIELEKLGKAKKPVALASAR